jgi:predicted TIM-barrel fold metal-dependent hydrolase
MDRCGVDRSVLIPFPVVEDYRESHDLIGRALQEHPGRFAGAACLPPFIPEESFRDELKRCAEELGFCALKFQPQYQALNPISMRSDFLFEAAIEHGLPMICHTGAGVPFALPSLFIMPARRFPELTLILGHAGGSLYFQEAIVAASVCSNIFIELSSLMPHHVAEVLAYISPSRLMIGSDLPESVETEMDKILRLNIDPEAKAAILFHNAERVFGKAQHSQTVQR